MLDAELASGVDTGGLDFVPGCVSGLLSSCTRIVQPALGCARLILWKKEGSHENARQIRASRCGPAGYTYLGSGPTTCDGKLSGGSECARQRFGCAGGS
jgi:hypothetical protein